MKRRFLFLDLLKAIALIEMVNGHTLDALLSSYQKKIYFWIFWQNVRGFTAPLFLFASGIAFSISTLNKKEYFHLSKKFFDRIRRIIFIITLGYLLHLPYFSLRKTLASPLSDLNNFFSVDILQCIGASILILQILYLISRNREVFMKLLFFVFINFYLLSIYLENLNLNLPLFFLKYFKNSLFPLTPFSLYLFSGCFIGSIFLNNEKKDIFIISSFISFLLFLTLKFYKIPANIIFFRISILSLISFLLLKFEGKKNKILEILQKFGKESLVVYFYHLIVIYGWVINKGLKGYFSGKLSFFQVYLIVIVLIISFLLLAIFWNYLKENKKEVYFKIKYFIYFSFISPFLLRPY